MRLKNFKKYIFIFFSFCASSGLSYDESRMFRLAEEKWNNANISETEIETYPSSFVPGQKRLPLTVVIDKNSKWNSPNNPRIEEIIEEAKSIFKENCNVSISPVTIVRLKHEKFNNLDCKKDYVFTADLPQGVHRPLVGLTDKLSCSYSNGTGYANPIFNRTKKESWFSLDTVFIEYTVWSGLFFEYPIAAKTLLAHELLHLFINNAHNYLTDNVMARKWSFRGRKVESDQCEMVKRHYLIR